MSEYKIMRGDIFYITKYGDTTGSEQSSGRPAVVVSNDKNNEHSPTVEIVYCTTKPKEDLPTHCTIRSTTVTSTVLCEQVTTVDKQRLGDYIGNCTEDEMSRINTAIRISLGLNDEYEKYNPFPEKEEVSAPPDTKNEPTPEDKAELITVRCERDTYKNLYEGLLNKLLPAGIGAK